MLATAGCLAAGAGAAERAADAIYSGGSIVTMIRDGDRVEALAVRDGRILATGDEEAVMALQGPDTRLVDLEGHCLMPGFIDPHSHVTLQSAKFSTVNLDPHPIGEVRTIADIQRKLQHHIEETGKEPGKWVFGWGYDDTGLEEMRHPNRDDLDAVSTEHPILLVHISSHLAACNSKALEVAGITADTPDPDGGRFQRREGSTEPNGVMEETAWMGFVANVPTPSAEQAVKMLEEGLEYYAAAGITTAGDGATAPEIMELMRALARDGRLPIDVVAYPVYSAVTDEVIEDVAANCRTPARLRPGGIKLVIDGSIQGFTAFLSEPYYRRPDGTLTAGCSCEGDAVAKLFLAADVGEAEGTGDAAVSGDTNRGYPNMTLEEVTKWVRVGDEKNIQIHAHCNGDAAIDLFLEALDTVYDERPRPELRNTIIHCQTVREDQLNRVATHGVIASFFPIHVEFWGDRHREIFLGPERAARIDPARSALDRGMKITLHHDAPIAGIGMLPVAAAAVNRVTTGGKVLGSEERITPYEALRAITKDAAWQYFEEHRKGTLEPGKLADLVVLDQDPLAVDPMQMKGIQVLETIKEGKTVYRMEASRADGETLEDSEWILLEADGVAVRPAARQSAPTLTLDHAAARAAGSTGVNQFTGGYQLDGTALEFGPAAVTRRAGPPEAMELEQQYLLGLGKVTAWEIADGRLNLLAGDKVVARFETAAPATSTITGTASFRERLALPPGAVFIAVLEDTSRADAAAEVLGTACIDPAGNPPYAFEIEYRPEKVDERHSYSVSAKIVDGDKLLFTSDTNHPVLTRGGGDDVEIPLKRVRR